jgi:hypothetical protein
MGNQMETFWEEKTPKGETHECCRCEKKTGTGSEGESRQEGNQTLKAEQNG